MCQVRLRPGTKTRLKDATNDGRLLEAFPNISPKLGRKHCWHKEWSFMHPFPSSDAMEAVTAARKVLSKSESEEVGDVPLQLILPHCASVSSLAK